jgi:hypothetical protein
VTTSSKYLSISIPPKRIWLLSIERNRLTRR